MIAHIIVSVNKKDITTFIENYLIQNDISKQYIYEISPLKNEITINQIRSLKKSLRVQVGQSRLFIFYDFHRSTIEAQNAFLKSLEERSETNHFILIVENEYALLPTVRSRSKVVNLNIKKSQGKIDLRIIGLLDSLEKSPQYEVLSSDLLQKLTREQSSEFIDQIILYYRSNLVKSASYPKILKKALQMRSLLKNNINPQLLIDNLLIFIKKATKMKE